MEELINLDLIDSNPYQLREQEDPDYIARLAEDIKRNGLMQTPMGRRVGDRVQLAFGHNRLSAMKHIRSSRMDNGFSRMPVVICDLTDLEMFERGTSENLARKNLNPLEEARGMVIYRDTFGKTSAEIGAYFGMSDSGVRNKIRLLKLPEDAQNWLRRGEISEGSARAMIPMFEELTRAEIQALEDSGNLKPSDVIECARSGIKADQVAVLVSRLLNRTHADEAPPESQAPQPTPVPVTPQPVYQPPQPVRQFPPPPTPAPIPSPARPAPQPAPTGAPAPVAEREEEDEDAPTPQPAAQPAAPIPWESVLYTLTLTYWPASSDGQRMVMASARVGQGAPLMATISESDLQLPAAIETLLEKLQAQHNGGA